MKNTAELAKQAMDQIKQDAEDARIREEKNKVQEIKSFVLVSDAMTSFLETSISGLRDQLDILQRLNTAVKEAKSKLESTGDTIGFQKEVSGASLKLFAEAFNLTEVEAQAYLEMVTGLPLVL